MDDESEELGSLFYFVSYSNDSTLSPKAPMEIAPTSRPL